jgi:cytochrome P450
LNQSVRIPGPGLVGFLHSLPNLRADTAGFLLNAARTYGDAVGFPVGRRQVVFFNHPDAVQHILQKNWKNYTKQTFQYRSLAAITGSGLATSGGSAWLRQRRLLQPLFGNSTHPDLIQRTSILTSQMLDGWEKHAKNHQPVDVQQEMLQLSLQILCSVLFDVTVKEPRTLTEAVLTMIDGVVIRTRSLAALINLPSFSRPQEQAASRFVRETINAWIEQKLAAGCLGNDLISTILRAREQFASPEAHLQQVRDEIMTFIIAGHETVASALTWSLILLAQFQAVQEDLTRHVAGAIGGQIPAHASRSQLSPLRGVVEETMRLYPPVWLITRKATQSDRILGYEIPAGALVILSPYTLHRHPTFWDDADRFAADRFLGEALPARHHFQYIPFGAGPRSCIGSNFALQEAQTVIAMVLQRFQIGFDRSPASIPIAAMVTLRPAQPVYLNLSAHPVEKFKVNPIHP